jgi:cell division septation protein DedD
MNYPNTPVGPDILNAFWAVLSGVIGFLVFLIVVALIFFLVRFLWFGTRAAQIYIAKNTAQPFASAPVATPAPAPAPAPAAATPPPAPTTTTTTKPIAKPATKPRTPRTPPTTPSA